MKKLSNGSVPFKNSASSLTRIVRGNTEHSSRRLSSALSSDTSSRRAHSWVTVIDPRNRRSLLQACDDCGVVKSENSVIRNCGAQSGQALISSFFSAATQIAI